jgi:uncharacterized repeat protein (TIGR03803 family)
MQRSASSIAALHAHEVTYKSIYSFGAAERRPSAGLIDVNGTLYGTTNGYPSSDGTVFAVSTSGNERVVYKFQGPPDGGYPSPFTGLIDVNRTLYGTAGGGASNLGTVFAVSTSGNERVVYSFQGPPDGQYPASSLIDVNGTLYGTTQGGGASNNGTVFAVNLSGNERVLYSFQGPPDGAGPGTLINVNGTLYGTGGGGASGDGIIFAVSTSGNERVVYNFQGAPDGAGPRAGLVDVNGTLYGTTQGGGASCANVFGHCGTIFEVSTSGNERVVYNFQGPPDGRDPFAVLTDVNGTLYGTTYFGGAGDMGSIFELRPYSR